MLRPPRVPGTQDDLNATIVRLNQSLANSLTNQRLFKQQVHSDLNAILSRLAVCADAVARVSGPSAAPAIIDLNNEIDLLDAAIAGIDGHRLSQTDVDEAIAPMIAQERNMNFGTAANRQAFIRAPPVYQSVDGARPRAFGDRSGSSGRPSDGSDGSAGSDGRSPGWFSGFPSLFRSGPSSGPSSSRSGPSSEIPLANVRAPPGGPPPYGSVRHLGIDPSRRPGDPDTVLNTTLDDDWRGPLGLPTGSVRSRTLGIPNNSATRLAPGGTIGGSRTRRRRR